MVSTFGIMQILFDIFCLSHKSSRYHLMYKFLISYLPNFSNSFLFSPSKIVPPFVVAIQLIIRDNYIKTRSTYLLDHWPNTSESFTLTSCEHYDTLLWIVQNWIWRCVDVYIDDALMTTLMMRWRRLCVDVNLDDMLTKMLTICWWRRWRCVDVDVDDALTLTFQSVNVRNN